MTKVRHVLGISGGKDSAALAIYMKQKYPTLEVEYYNSDTGCELEETEKLVNNLESFLGKIERLKAAEGSPEPTPFDHFLKISGGYLPSPQARWCTNKMKLAEFEKFVGDEPTVSYVGIRGDEDREGYVSTKPNIQAVFPFRRNIWSLDVIHKALHNDNLDVVTELYKEWASDNIKEEAVEIASTPINKSFYYSRKLNALLDLSVKTFNRVVYEFLKTTDYPVGKLEEFPLIDNEDILVKEDIFSILEESGVGIPAYYKPIEFEVDGKKGEYCRSRSGCYFCFFQQRIEWMLVETFSDVKDFEAYFEFMEYATKKADQARDNAQKLDKKNTDRIKQLNRTIEFETGTLNDIEREIKNKENEAVNFNSLLKSIEQSKESSKLLIAVNRRIETLSQKRSQMQNRIDENYTINLLDDMWILMGFADIAEEYSCKVSEVDKKRRKLEQNYLFTAGQEKAIKKMQTDFVPLPVHIPGQKVMQEMLDEEVCKICGRPAKKHSEAWEFMLHRLEEYMESLKVPEDEEIAPFYLNDYIVELQKRDTTLNDNLSEITKLRHKIQEAIAFNNRMHDEVKKIDENLNMEFEQKKRILSQTDGLTEEQLLANYENISNWVEQKNKAENRIDVLKRQRAQHRAALDEAQDALSKLAEGTSAAIYAKTAQIIRQISEAFKSAKETNKKRLLHAIEDESNEFLEKLNSNDFKGTIRIIEKANGQGEAVLMNNDNTRIFTPNTALRTTYLMSVLFAIGKLSSEKDKTEFPLLFDAPTSSFTDAKESEFFNVISKLKKQVIIVTKSFLKDKNGEVVLDQSKVSEVNGSVFRIEKKKPFDDKKLGTIQTVISKIK